MNNGTVDIVKVKKEVKAFEGVFKCDLDLHIHRATADYQYVGPKISKEVWWQVLAFFEWTYELAHSESQVRLYVNPRLNEWKAWAFPQKRGTGMTTDEFLTHERWAASAALFDDREGWFYYGTVHHHCSAGAFQSGTDAHNETSIDGLHITIGKVGKTSTRFDIHCRLYQSGWKLSEPDMSKFWDIGANARLSMPEDLHDRIARYQMCEKPPADQPFPQDWKDNYITPPVVPATTYRSQYGTHEFGSSTIIGFNNTRYSTGDDRVPTDVHYDCRQGGESLVRWLVKMKKSNEPVLLPDNKCTLEEFIDKMLLYLEGSKVGTELCRIMWCHDLTPAGLRDAFIDELVKHEADEADRLAKAAELAKKVETDAEKAVREMEEEQAELDAEEAKAKQTAEGGRPTIEDHTQDGWPYNYT